MLNIIIKLFKKFGIDRSIFYTTLSRFIQAIGGIISILFVAKYLSGTEQGFYYTFGSVLAIQVFFELGLNGIITQYVAHEVSHLKWSDKVTLIGENKYLSRISSLLHFSIKWYSSFAFILLTTLLIVGFIFFNKYDLPNGNIDWKAPWVLLSISTSISLLATPILSFLEGLGKVKEVAKIRLIQLLICLGILWGGLFLGGKLYVAGVNSLAGIIIVLLFVFFGDFKKILINIWKINISERVDYKKEIFPFQWKIALSWISGYFIFQLFNPVLFATEGAVVAGQMGMTLAALNGVLSLSLSWMTTKVPLFSGLIAQQKFNQLDHIFNKTLIQSSTINGLGLVTLFALIVGLRYFNYPLGDRFLPYLPLTFMIIPIFLNHSIASWATYLRCHKQEPFLIPSIVGAITTSISTVVLGKYFGVVGMTMGYCILTFLGGYVWGFIIFKLKKAAWHG